MKRHWVLRSDAVVKHCEKAIEEAASSGKLWRVTLEPYAKPRTLPQNNTIHMWIGEIAEQTGESKARMKEVIKKEFYPRVEKLILGRLVVLPKSTSELSVVEMIVVMEQIQAMCAEFDITLTQPDPTLAT